jgi:arylsulfatase A-like enzyme
MTKNEKTDALVEYVDIYPTLSELAGIEAPDYIHGESLVPILKNPSQKFKSEIYSRYQMREVVQDLDYSYHEIIGYDKYFKDRNGNNTPSPDSNERVVAKMLFDMRTDKLQSIDISNEPRYKEVVEKYSKKLLNMRKITNEPILIK